MRARDIQNIGQNPHDYIRGLLHHKNADNLTRICGAIVNDDSSVSIWLHSTEIVRAYSDGRTILRNGGWDTVTTKRYLNKFLPLGIVISQSKFVWYVNAKCADSYDRVATFTDGMSIVIDYVGKFQNVGAPKLPSLVMRKIHEMVSGFIFGTDYDATESDISRYVDSLGFSDTDDQWARALWCQHQSECLSLAVAMRQAIGR